MAALPLLDPRTLDDGQIVPARGQAVLIRDELGDRRQGLAENGGKRSLDVAAMILADLYGAITGRVPFTVADRTPRYRRDQLAGKRALPIEDLVHIVLTDPEAAEVALEPLLYSLGRRSVPVDDPDALGSVASEAVHLVETLTDHLAAWTRLLHRTETDGPARRRTDAGNLSSPAYLRGQARALAKLVDQAGRLMIALNRRADRLEEATP